MPPNGRPEWAKDVTGKRLDEKRYEMADPHITIRAGMVYHQQYQADQFACMVSGHLYVRLDSEEVPMLDRPMLETDRKFVEADDYRVDEIWVWQGKRVKQPLMEKPRLGFKRVHDDGDYSSYYAEHHHACKRYEWDVNGDAVRYTTKRSSEWTVNKAGIIGVERPPNGLYLPRPLLDKLEKQEEERQERLAEERREKAEEERRKKQEAKRSQWRKSWTQSYRR
ncbi:hypothetical protein SLS62_008730 [Diatrype stigma]|uniref:Uncharacterized protein n=1 Tax=Diatrype stigma TaxID=117547 RepID=A0AAN9UKN7_9PEZI